MINRAWNRSPSFRWTQWICIMPTWWVNEPVIFSHCVTRTPLPCPVESLHWSWWYCPFKVNANTKPILHQAKFIKHLLHKFTVLMRNSRICEIYAITAEFHSSAAKFMYLWWNSIHQAFTAEFHSSAAKFMYLWWNPSIYCKFCWEIHVFIWFWWEIHLRWNLLQKFTVLLRNSHQFCCMKFIKHTAKFHSSAAKFMYLWWNSSSIYCKNSRFCCEI